MGPILALCVLFLFPIGCLSQGCRARDQFPRVPENNNIGYNVTELIVEPDHTVQVASDSFAIVGLDLILTVVVDYEEVQLLMVDLLCKKGDIPVPSQTVFVNIININDNEPIFPETSYEFTVSEDLAVGSSIGPAVTAVDADQDILHYVLSGNDANAVAYFRLSSITNPVILVNKALDYDSYPIINMNLTVRDTVNPGDSPSHTATAAITVVINDADDKLPFFQPCIQHHPKICISTGYSSSVNQSQQATEPLHLMPSPLYAVDGDYGINIPINYSIINGNAQNVFAVQNNGNITMNKAIDTLGTIFLQVMAYQFDDALRYSLTTVQIEVKEKSNFPPAFESPIYYGNVATGSETKSFVRDSSDQNRPLEVFAADDDFPDRVNPAIIYKIENSTDFSILRDGYILTNTIFSSSDTIVLLVTATDSGTAEAAATIVTVEITAVTTTPPTTTSTTSRAGTTTSNTPQTSTTPRTGPTVIATTSTPNTRTTTNTTPGTGTTTTTTPNTQTTTSITRGTGTTPAITPNTKTSTTPGTGTTTPTTPNTQTTSTTPGTGTTITTTPNTQTTTSTSPGTGTTITTTPNTQTTTSTSPGTGTTITTTPNTQTTTITTPGTGTTKTPNTQTTTSTPKGTGTTTSTTPMTGSSTTRNPVAGITTVTSTSGRGTATGTTTTVTGTTNSNIPGTMTTTYNPPGINTNTHSTISASTTRGTGMTNQVTPEKPTTLSNTLGTNNPHITSPGVGGFSTGASTSHSANTVGAPQGNKYYTVTDMAVLGASLGVILALCLIGLGLLIYKQYGNSIRKGLQRNYGDNFGGSNYSTGLINEGDISTTPVPTNLDSDFGGINGIEPMSSNKFLDSVSAVSPVLSLSTADSPPIETEENESDSDDTKVKSILTKELKEDVGYKSVWFREDTAPEVVVIEGVEEGEADEYDEDFNNQQANDDDDDDDEEHDQDLNPTFNIPPNDSVSVSIL